MPEELALDTTVLVRANVSLASGRQDATLLAARLRLLKRVNARQAVVLISARLAKEYTRRLASYRNDLVLLVL